MGVHELHGHRSLAGAALGRARARAEEEEQERERHALAALERDRLEPSVVAVEL
jgi:hypothetical protein